VWDEFEGTIVDIQGVVQQEEQRPTKRVKLDHKAGKKAIQGLLEGYGSSGEDEEETEASNMLAGLDQYAGSDEGSEVNVTGTDDGEDDEDDLDPRVLLELMRNARERDKGWAIEEDEAVDWGDEEVEDDGVMRDLVAGTGH
jgi:hypothetical protein